MLDYHDHHNGHLIVRLGDKQFSILTEEGAWVGLHASMEDAKKAIDQHGMDEWAVLDTPCFPNRYKLVRIGVRSEDNSPSNFFPTMEAARAEVARRMEGKVNPPQLSPALSKLKPAPKYPKEVLDIICNLRTSLNAKGERILPVSDVLDDYMQSIKDTFPHFNEDLDRVVWLDRYGRVMLQTKKGWVRDQELELPELPQGYVWHDVNYDTKHASVIYPDHQEDRHTFAEWSNYLADASKGRYVSELAFQIEGRDCYPVKPMCGSSWQFVCPQALPHQSHKSVEALRRAVLDLPQIVVHKPTSEFHTTVEAAIAALQEAADRIGCESFDVFMAAKNKMLKRVGKIRITIKNS